MDPERAEYLAENIGRPGFERHRDFGENAWEQLQGRPVVASGDLEIPGLAPLEGSGVNGVRDGKGDHFDAVGEEGVAVVALARPLEMTEDGLDVLVVRGHGALLGRPRPWDERGSMLTVGPEGQAAAGSGSASEASSAASVIACLGRRPKA